MSWLNFNESLNTIKGQLSNFASGVLAEEVVNNAEDDRVGKKDKSEEEDFNLNSSVRQSTTYNDNNWAWESPIETPTARIELTYGLQTKIDMLEKEKEELLKSLEQLDLDHQQTMEKVLSLKENLQRGYNELTNDYEKLKKEYGVVLNENMERNKEIEALRNHSHGDENQLKQEMQQQIQHSSEENKNLLNAKESLELKVQLLEQELKSKNAATAELNSEDLLKKCNEQIEQLHFDKAQLIIDKDVLQTSVTNLQAEKNQLLLIVQKLEIDNQKSEESAVEHELKTKIHELEQMRQKSLEEKQRLHEKYINIITESMKKHMDLDASVPSTVLEEQPQILEFANKVETLLKLLLDFKSKTESLEEEICQITQEKNNIIAEKNFEIEKLLQNSEILSQEVITKTRAIKDYEDECAELMKNNDLLIIELQNFKKSGLQTISESNEDNLLLMESQLENANKKIEDMEIMISDLENSKQESNDEVQTELEYIKRQLNMTGQELSKSKDDNQELLLSHKQLEEEKNGIKTVLEKVKADYENIEYKYTEINVTVETLREENEECRRKIAVLDAKCKKFEDLNLMLENKIELLQTVIDEQKDQLIASEEKLGEKDLQIRNFVERLQNSKMSETGLKLQVDTIYKELQNALEAKLNLQTRLEDESKLVELDLELKTVRDECDRIKNAHTDVVQLNSDLHEKNALLEAQLEELSQSRNELIALVTAKHEENVNYHAEIQRLSAETIAPEELAKKNEELEKVVDQNNFLREKCEVLAQNFLEEQSKVQKIISEHNTSSEKELSLMKELERLRAHLVEVEEMYTQELVQAEQRNKDMQAKVNEIEQREKNSSSIYTSVSIRANQQVETLQTQLQLVSNQRDELRVKMSDIEDENNKHVAALTNLQFVLEQFQKDKEKDVYMETERIRRQITQEKKIQDDLRNDNNNLKMQLEESKQGLQAAARLTDQLEKTKKQMVNLKDEVTKLEEKLQKSEVSCKELSAQSDTKVDKSLIKNLIIGYISSSPNDQKQILKIIATVLDFNKKESDKVYLNKQNTGWLSSILHPQGLSNPGMTNESLSAAFVRFLENESKPKVLPNLLTSKQRKVSEDASSTCSTPPPLVLSEIVLPTFVDFGKNRNSSSILKDVLKDNT
ncbi:hypothetical protein RN001_015260 [Aquatica leii]|uniref:GRIP domain-containing protein n=1 Tax=Aquatica leii TaxID=1421715 RepID=A0AAN7P353_9COLE|nr:hypothetical protein RN001_015260 [Aquatica leii]